MLNAVGARKETLIFLKIYFNPYFRELFWDQEPKRKTKQQQKILVLAEEGGSKCLQTACFRPERVWAQLDVNTWMTQDRQGRGHATRIHCTWRAASRGGLASLSPDLYQKQNKHYPTWKKKSKFYCKSWIKSSYIFITREQSVIIYEN